MNTIFFQNIADLQMAGNLNITISTADSGKLSISIYLSNPKAGEQSGKQIPPLLLKGSPQELDEGFFEAVTAPLQQTDGLLLNIADYQKGQEKAKSSAKVTTDKKPKDNAPKDDIEVAPKPDKEDKKKEYMEAIRKIAELTALCKFEDALAILPSVNDFPEKTAEILKRKSDLEKMNAQKQLLWND